MPREGGSATLAAYGAWSSQPRELLDLMPDLREARSVVTSGKLQLRTGQPVCEHVEARRCLVWLVVVHARVVMLAALQTGFWPRRG